MLTTAMAAVYAASAGGWHVCDHMLPVAFVLFRVVLLTGGNWCYRHLEVSVVYPHRAR